MFKKIVQSIESQNISIGQWLIAFAGIVFIRFILEVISSPTQSGIIPVDAPTLIQYGLSFIAIALGLVCIVWFFTKGSTNLLKLILFCLPVIWIGPILDIIFSAGIGHTITYIFHGPKLLLIDFLTFFGPQVTIGLRLELFIILLAIGLYVWKVKKSIIKTILSVLFSYVFLFFIFALPSIIYLLGNISDIGNQASTYNVLHFLIKNISESNISHNTIDATLTYSSNSRAFELGFDKLLSQISFLLSFVFILFIFYKTQKEKFITIIKNSRPERVLFYTTLLGLGSVYAVKLNLGQTNNWIDLMSIITLIISWYGAWMFAVHTNDIADEQIDLVSNLNRPITNNKVSVTEMRETGYIWLLLSLLGAFSIGYYPFFMILTFTAAYYIYSYPPLRLKRIPLLSSFLISIACLSTIMAGFYFVSTIKTLNSFPGFLAIGIIIIFTLATNIRDIKDIEGDKKDGIFTIPVIFNNKGKKIVALMFSTSFILAPFFFSSYLLYISAIPTSVIGYKIVTRKVYKESLVFCLYFVFFLSLLVLI